MSLKLQLEFLDYFAFFLIALFTLFAAFYASRNNSSKQASWLDYILMGRRLSLPLFITSLVATWYGGIFGVTRIAYESGIYNFITQGIFWYITYLIMAFYFVHKIKQHNALTLPELIKNTFGPKSAKLAAVFNFFNVVPIAYSISLGVLLQALFGGELWMWIILGTSFVVFYSSFSGFASVVYTDVVQFFVMCGSVFLVLVLSIYNFGGIGYLKENLPEHYFSITAGHGYLNMFVWGLIALSTLVDPNFYQRIFASKDVVVAKKGIIISTMIWFVFDISTTFGAMYARLHLADFDPNQAYLFYAMEILPAGLRGLFLAGIAATILSTMDSYFFIASNTLSYDLLPNFAKKYSRPLSLFFVAMISILLSFLFEGNIRMVWRTLGSYSAGCLLVPLVYFYITNYKFKDTNFVFICLASLITMTLWRLLGYHNELDAIYIGVMTSALAILQLRLFEKLRS